MYRRLPTNFEGKITLFPFSKSLVEPVSNDFCKLRLIANHQKDGRVYNVPIVSEVAALIAGDVDTCSGRDIIL